MCVFVALGIQHAMRMRHIVFLWPAPLYNIFLHYLIQGTIFRGEKKLLNVKCLFQASLLILSETFIILRRTERDMIENVYGLHVKYHLLLSDCNEP